jgi:hypothetical protein
VLVVAVSVTVNVCAPSARPVTACGDGHGLTTAPESTWHLNAAPDATVSLYLNVADLWFVNIDGPESNTIGLGAAAATAGKATNEATAMASASMTTSVAPHRCIT